MNVYNGVMSEKNNGLGRRIALYRKNLGFSNTKDLADRINNPKITHAVISNIESGRRSDPAVSEVIEIARGLGISPVFLLAPLFNPAGKIDLPNISDELSNVSAAEFLRWFSLERSALTGKDPEQFDLYKALRNAQLLQRIQQRCQRIRTGFSASGVDISQIDKKSDKSWIMYQDDLHDWYNLRYVLMNNPFADTTWVDDSLLDEIDLEFSPSNYPWLSKRLNSESQSEQ
jgi:transcriptional regulator with XRE-family HTH domain